MVYISLWSLLSADLLICWLVFVYCRVGAVVDVPVDQWSMHAFGRAVYGRYAIGRVAVDWSVAS